MKRSSGRPRIRDRKRSDAAVSLKADPSDQEYRVGPGRPPKEYQFKPGQSGNPKGARRKSRSIAPDLKALFERALSRKVTLRQGEQERISTKAAAGIEQLVNQHGFLLSDGFYTTLDDPLATGGTQAFGINDAGQIVGTYETATGTHSFLFSGGVFTAIDDPAVNSHTRAHGINNNGQIVGTLSDGTGDHGYLETTFPNPPPPAGTTPDMILRGANESPAVAGYYEIYDLGNNAILAGYELGQVGTNWQFAGLGGFFGSDTTDMLLRNSSTGGFEVYDIANNNITGAALAQSA